MTLFKRTRDLLLESYDDGDIDEDAFLLLYRPQNLKVSSISATRHHHCAFSRFPKRSVFSFGGLQVFHLTDDTRFVIFEGLVLPVLIHPSLESFKLFSGCCNQLFNRFYNY